MKKRGGVPKSSLRRDESEKRPLFLEPLHGVQKNLLDTKKYDKPRKSVTIMQDDELKLIQYFTIRQITNGFKYSGLDKHGHNGKWMCVKYSQEGGHEKIDCGEEITDNFFKGEKWRNWLSIKNSDNIFCVPQKYEKIMEYWRPFLDRSSLILMHI
jgi:hypothetical protein